MKSFFATTIIVTGAMLAAGCATKKYVRNTTAPVQAKVDQVGQQTAQNTAQIQDTRNQVKQVDERAQSGISAAQERAATADQHAGEAMTKASAADQKAEQNAQGLGNLRNVVANLDDYKLQTSTTVQYGFNRYTLTPADQAMLDKLAGEVKADKRYFIAIEGYTDSVGSREYNLALSRRRAEAVENYLVGHHDIPLYRIHIIGMGEMKPVDEARSRAARAKNRRVDVKVFSADQVLSSLSAASEANRQDPAK